MDVRKPNEIYDDIIAFLSNKSLVPIIGSGLSVNLPAYRGSVPSGEDYQNYMISQLEQSKQLDEEEKDSLKMCNFSRICDYYEDDNLVDGSNRRRYLHDNFYKVILPDEDVRKKFFDIDWPYIYSLNIDDMVEVNSVYKGKILPSRKVNEDFFNSEKCIIKLHGDIEELLKYDDAVKIFTTQEYVQSLINNEYLLDKLRNDYAYQNILYIGCSLDNELDLLSLQSLPINFKQKETLKKVFYFMKGEPGRLKKSILNKFGITDIVCFEEYDDIYNFLEKAWNIVKEKQTDNLFQYSVTTVNVLDASQKADNQKYFYSVDGLYDTAKRSLTFPYFFISRNISLKIQENLNVNKVHLFFGTHFSGESYLLADLVRKIRNKKVYYFDGKTRISDAAVDELINKKDIVALFDIGTINRYQFEEILSKSKDIHDNGNNFIIALRNNDSDTLGIVKWKLREGIIEKTDILTYKLENKLVACGEYSELKSINDKLPKVGLPPYMKGKTFLDHLLQTEDRFGTEGRYILKPIDLKNEKERILMVILGIKEKLYSQEIVSFNLEHEITKACDKYSPYIEKEIVDLFEKSNADLSSTKYVVNSKYWIQKQLGEYVKDKKNWKRIGDAFVFIISKLLKFEDISVQKRRERTRDFILFDRLNELFFDDKSSNNIWLILEIYHSLEQYLSRDHQFLHQCAKGYLIGADKTANIDDAIQLLHKAEEKVLLADAIIDEELSYKYNEKLMISKSHIQYTIAVIQSKKCQLQEYNDKRAIQRAILSIKKALSSEYNTGDFSRMAKKYPWEDEIKNFVSYCFTNINNLKVEKKYKEVLNEILNTLLYK